MKTKDFVQDHFTQEVFDLDPDALIFGVRQVKEDGGKQWHYFYIFDDEEIGATEEVVGAAHTLLNILTERRLKLLMNADKPNKG